jgi:hypothetical protein
MSMSIPRTAVFLAILSALCGCGGTHRISRPELRGFVYDAETGKPLRGCQVGEVNTDAKGYFMLPRKTSPKTSFEGSNPPPLLISEFVIFQGYEMVRLYSFKPWGASALSSPLEMNPILLRKLDGEEKTGTGPPWREVSAFAPVSTARQGRKDLPSPFPDQ